MAKPGRLIKRYAGQRLYDTQAARYIDLEDMASSVRAGEEIRVLDADTGRDITQSVAAPNERTRH